MSRFTGTAFDKSYADLEVFDHMQDIQETSDEVKMGTNHQIRKDLARAEAIALRGWRKTRSGPSLVASNASLRSTSAWYAATARIRAPTMKPSPTFTSQ